jgi:lipopolysaccharide assembly outer membrane protein LptD (OstA)
MQRLRFLFILVCLTGLSVYAAQQTSGQRLHNKIAVTGQQPKLLLPKTNAVEMSALAMEKDESGAMMHLKGDVEIRLSVGTKFPTTVLRTDEAVYDINTGEIQTRGNLKISTEK